MEDFLSLPLVALIAGALIWWSPILVARTFERTTSTTKGGVFVVGIAGATLTVLGVTSLLLNPLAGGVGLVAGALIWFVTRPSKSASSGPLLGGAADTNTMVLLAEAQKTLKERGIDRQIVEVEIPHLTGPQGALLPGASAAVPPQTAPQAAPQAVPPQTAPQATPQAVPPQADQQTAPQTVPQAVPPQTAPQATPQAVPQTAPQAAPPQTAPQVPPSAPMPSTHEASPAPPSSSSLAGEADSDWRAGGTRTRRPRVDAPSVPLLSGERPFGASAKPLNVDVDVDDEDEFLEPPSLA